MASEHKSAWRRATDQPRFAQAIRSRYQGSFDALEMLWWLGHPLQPTPEGTESPLERIRALEREVYSRPDRSGGGVPSAERELQELKAKFDDDLAAIHTALEGAEKRISPIFSDDPHRHDLRSVLSARVIAAWVISIILGAGIGFAAGHGILDAELAQRGKDVPHGIELLNAAQRESDLPPVVPHGLRETTIRKVSAPAVPTSYPVGFIGRDGADRLCLFVFPSASAVYLQTCVRESDIAADGLNVAWTQPMPGAAGSSLLEERAHVTWKIDGLFTSGGQVSPQDPAPK